MSRVGWSWCVPGFVAAVCAAGCGELPSSGGAGSAPPVSSASPRAGAPAGGYQPGAYGLAPKFVPTSEQVLAPTRLPIPAPGRFAKPVGRANAPKASGAPTLYADGTPNFLAVTNIGSTQGLSYARAINNHSVVVGTDTLVDNYIYDSFYAVGARAFRWTEAEGQRTYLAPPDQASFADDINDSGVISGILSTTTGGVTYPFRFDALVDTQPVIMDAPGNGGGINSSGTMTGGAYFPSGLNMFRIGTGAADVLPSIFNSDIYYESALGHAIGDNGTVVGQQLTPNGWEAVMYSDSSASTVPLNGLLPAGSDWNLDVALGIKTLQPVSGSPSVEIVGWGQHPSTGIYGAFRLRLTLAGAFVDITDLGILPQYDRTLLYIPQAAKENASGEIVGAIYDPSGTVPINAFVYTDASKMVDLNTLVDTTHWDLRLASGINDLHEVVGFGYMDGNPLAFKLTLPDLSACPPPTDACQGPGVKDFLSGECSYPPANEGGTCGNDLCVTEQVCQSGVCSAGTPVTCAVAEACHSAGVCNPASGLCATTASDNDTPCDDGNSCTVGDQCEGGVCMPGAATATACSAPGANHYLSVIDLGSQQGLSYARGINNNHVVVGADVNSSAFIYDGAYPGSRGFIWSAGQPMSYLPSSSSSVSTRADAINDSGVVSGTLSFPDLTTYPFRYDSVNDSLPVQASNPGYGGGRVNASGIMTGGFYDPVAGLAMFRIGAGTTMVLPAAPGGGTEAVGLGIDDPNGTVVGEQLVEPSMYGAVRYSDARGAQLLNDILQNSAPADVAAQWNLSVAYGIKSSGGAGDLTGDIIGWGFFDGQPHGFRLKTNPAGDFASITDLGVSQISTDEGLSFVIPSQENASGEIVGGVYDDSGTDPVDAFVYTDATGMVDLSSLVDSGSRWHLRAALGINDSHEVVGYGFHNGQPRAFKVTLPDLSACPAPANPCQTAAPRNLLTGLCSNPPIAISDGPGCSGGGTTLNVTLAVVGIAKDSYGNTKAIFSYQMSGSPVDIPYGPANGLSDQDGFIDAPVELPPQNFAAPGGSFAASLTGSQLTWTVAGQSVTATPSSPLLPTTTLPDGTQVVVVADGPPVPLDPPPPELANAIVASDTSYTTIDQSRDTQLASASQAPGPGLPPLWQKSPNQIGPTSAGSLPGNFQVTDDGAAEYVIPLDLPRGRNGVEPSLALAYNSRSGNGAYGPGWVLRGISQITRCNTSFATANDRGQDPAAITFTDSDTFCANGQELVPVNIDGIDGFRTRRDDETRYTITGRDGLGPTTFKAERKDGLIDEFGVDSGSRGETIRGLPGSQTTVRYGWGLSRRTDRYGNEMDIDYIDTPDGRAPSIKTPISIKYTSNPATGRIATNTVTFKYQSIPFPSTPPVHWSAGANMSFNDDLKVTGIQVNGPNPIALVTTYKLTYSAPSITGQPLLTRVQRCDGAGVCMAPTTFSWDVGSYDFSGSDTIVDDLHDGTTTYSITSQYAQAATRTLVVGDFNADGQDDLLYRTSVDTNLIGDDLVPAIDKAAIVGWITAAGAGHGFKFATNIANSHVPLASINPSDRFGANNITTTPIVGDFNNDGFADVVVPFFEEGLLSNIFYQTTGGTLLFQQQVQSAHEDYTTTGFTAPILADFNGDGLVDAARELTEGSQGIFGARLNAGGVLGDYAQLPSGLGVWNAYCAPTDCPKPTQLVALDLDGDGRTEVVMSSTDMTSTYGIHAGVGGLTTIAANLAPKSTVIRVLDYNGDGLSDFLAQKGTGTDVELWVNTGNGFMNGPPNVVDASGNPSTFPRSDLMLHSSFVADFNGDGMEDVLMMSCQLASFGPAGPPILYLSTGNGFVQLSLSAIPSPVQISAQPSSGQVHPQPVCPSAVMDVDGDGQKDIVQSEDGKKALQAYIRPPSRVDHLTHVRNGLESTVSIQYSNYSPPLTETCAYPYACSQRHAEVVSGYSLDNGVPQSGVSDPLQGTHYTMTYSGVRVDALGAGLLGFDSIVSRDDTTGVGYTRQYDLTTRIGNWYPRAGLPTFVQTDAVISKGPQAGYHVYRSRSTVFEQLQSDPNNNVGPYAVQPYTIEEVQYEVPPNPSPQVPTISYRVRQTDYTYTYDRFGNVSTSDKKDLTNADEFTQYDVSNNPQSWILGQVNDFTITSTSASGEVDTSKTTFDVDPNTGAVNGKTTDPGDPAMQLNVAYSRNGDGLIYKITETPIGGEARVSKIKYDTITGAWPATLTNPLHQSTRLVYHSGLGVLVSSQDANDVYTVIRQFDGFGRLRVETEGAGLATSYHYARVVSFLGEPIGGPTTLQPGMKTTWTDSTGRFGTVGSDSLGREFNRDETAFDGIDRIEIARVYDPATGGVSRITGPFGASNDDLVVQPYSMTYDEFGRLTSTTVPTGSVLTTQYSGAEQVDQLDGTTKRTRLDDTTGKIINTTTYEPTSPSPGGQVTTTYDYGPFGTLRHVHLPGGSTVTMSYDHMARPTGLTDPDAGNRITHYNPFGEIIREELPGQADVTYIRDDLGRVSQITQGTSITTYQWDTAANGIGKLDFSLSPSGVKTSYQYYPNGLTQTTTSLVDGQTFVFDRTYDPAGRLQTITYPDIGASSRYTVTLGYGGDGRVATVKSPGGDFLWQKTATASNGMTSLEVFGQAISATHDYDPNTGVLSHISAGNGTVITEQDGGRTFTNAIQSLGYTYYPDGKLQGRTDYGLEAREGFSYDNTDRVRHWTTSATRTGTDVQYQYDDLGNLIERDATDASGTVAEVYQYGQNGAGPHALTTGPLGTYSYDASGRQAARPGQPALSYTYFDLPTTVQRDDGTNVTFEYDADGTRVVKSAPSGTVTSIEGLYEERVQGGTTTHVFYLPGDDVVVGQIECPAGGSPAAGTCLPPEFVHPDRLGTIDTVSSNGAATGKEKRDPYGRSYSPTNMSAVAASMTLGFIGAGEDSETGLINLNHRLYDAQLGRFISTDPLVKDPFDGREYNRYAYGSNNPLSFTDPSGLQDAPPLGAPPDQQPYTPPPPIEVRCTHGGGTDTCVTTEFDGRPIPDVIRHAEAVALAAAAASAEAAEASAAAAAGAAAAQDIRNREGGVRNPFENNPFGNPNAPPGSLHPSGAEIPSAPTFNSPPSPSQDFANGNRHWNFDPLDVFGKKGVFDPDVNTRLEKGPGLHLSGDMSNKFGTAKVIDALRTVGAKWAADHPGDPRITVRDISREGGGPLAPHHSHQHGVDVDIRVFANDGTEQKTSVNDPVHYSRALTQDLVNDIAAQGNARIQSIFSADKQLQGPGMSHDDVHIDHFHVRFFP